MAIAAIAVRPVVNRKGTDSAMASRTKAAGMPYPSACDTVARIPNKYPWIRSQDAAAFFAEENEQSTAEGNHRQRSGDAIPNAGLNIGSIQKGVKASNGK
jgi:hypothetical protein